MTCELTKGQVEVEKLKEKYKQTYSKLAKKIFPSSVPIPVLGKASSKILGLMANNDIVEPILFPSLKCQVDNKKKQKTDRHYKTLERYELERLCAVAKVNKDDGDYNILELYKQDLIQKCSKGTGILDLFTYRGEDGRSYLGASDSGCTSALALESLVEAQGILTTLKPSHSVVQVARGTKTRGKNYLALPPLESVSEVLLLSEETLGDRLERTVC